MQNQFTSLSAILEVERSHRYGYDLEDTSFDCDKIEPAPFWDGFDMPRAVDMIEICPCGEICDLEVDPPDCIELDVSSDCEEADKLDPWDAVKVLREQLWVTLDAADDLLCELAEIRGRDMLTERCLKDAIEELLLGS